MSDFVHESVAAYGAELRLMTVREYMLAAQKGVFRADEKIELLRGEVIRMSPQNHPHTWAVMSLRESLRGLFPDASFIDQSTFPLDDWNAPEPDVLVLRGAMAI